MKNQTINSLNGKTVVITGASSGVGLATAEAFAKRGCHLVLAARGEEGLAKAVERCEELGANVLAVITDVANYEDVKKLAAAALNLSGKIDFWINNAGVMASGKFEDIPIDVSQQVIKTNLFGYLHGAHLVLPIFKTQGYGTLINNVSIGGFMPAPYSAVYSATKAGIKVMMECLQGDISDQPNVHICNLYPQIQRSTGNMHAAKYSGLAFKVPPFAADPKDTAAAIVNLAVHPQKDKFPDLNSWLIKNIHGLFPKLVVNTASAGLRLLMQLKKAPDQQGNILQPSSSPHQIYGETIMPTPSRNTKFVIALGLGLSLGYVLLGGKKS